MRKLILGAALAAVAAPVPALADPPPWAPAHGRRAHEEAARQQYYRGDSYAGPTWQGRDGRTYCRRSNGTTGLIVGAGAGALLGRAIDTHGSRTTGTVLGAAAGALLGREATRKVRCN
ncbi:glycine zipper 2TM domain-containing protein [Sphingomonas tabacisoli]|uniref:17 kDa surface antigen n=1 Tax=Sphingomonas tabacisoli TaxID=2249466 RepID=A0ABW4I363_9SPHN